MTASTRQLLIRTLPAMLVLACVLPSGVAFGNASYLSLVGVTLCLLVAGVLLAHVIENAIERLVAERDQAIGMHAQLQALADRLAHAADHDDLTGLLNRARFHAALQRHIHASGSGSGSGNGDANDSTIVLFIDVDDFKAVNDTHGHGMGDEVLRMFSRRLRDSVRDTDLVARLGGDEFAVLLAQVHSEQAQSLARDLTERLSLPYEIGDQQVLISASIGMASSRGPETSAKDLLEAADAAMYLAKEGGKRRFAVSGWTQPSGVH